MAALPQVRRYGAVAMAVAYPICAHLGTWRKSPELVIASVVLLAAAILARPLMEKRTWAWAAAPVAALGIYGLWRIDAAALVLYLPPVALNLFLAWLFGHTLRSGSVSLIERLARLVRGAGVELEAGLERYAHRLTAAWTALFLTLAAVNLGLAMLATPGGLMESAGFRPPAPIDRAAWSLFANVLNYVIVAVFFLLEYAYRSRRFPDRPYRNLLDFLRQAAAAGPSLMATFGRPRAEAGAQMLETGLAAPAHHPAFAGHFPGRPVLPGVVLLECVAEEAGRKLGSRLRVSGIPRVKFLAPLEPGDCATLRFRREGELLHFELLRASERIAVGILLLAQDEVRT